ncbi:MAG: glycosyltransferase family 39 protein [Lentisphaerae bacterium]|nr:glycosyltransferase family 39 protein [Lentisphaerota bacterium]
MNVSSPSRLAALGMFAAVAMVCFAGLDRQPLYETDEGFAANRSDSFYRHHTWRLSYDDVGETGPQYRKPPLLYWCVAGLYGVIGRNLWAVRLPTALASFAAVWLTWRLARRFFDDRCALVGAALLVTVPFAVLHIRTAMLEMPLVALLLAGIWCFAFAPRAAGRVFGAGLAGAAAIMIKGAAGAYVTVIPILFGLWHRRFTRRACLEALLVPIVALLPPLLYFLMIPEPFRTEMARHLFVEEAAERVRVFDHVGRHVEAAFNAVATPLRWHLVAGLLGLVIAFAGAMRRRERPAWPVLTLLAAIPPMWVFASMVHPFPRYLLPLYPFILVLAAHFVWCATATPAAAWWLLPYAAGAIAIGWGDPWLWGPAATALIVFAATRRQPLRTSPAFVPAARLLLLLGLVAPSTLSAVAWTFHPPPEHLPRPELIPLARRIQDLVPADGRVVVEERMKCHTLLFYGRRAIDSISQWLLTDAVPGETRYGIFQTFFLANIPNLDASIVDESGPWKLVRLHVHDQAAPWAGVLFCLPHRVEHTAATLTLLEVSATPFQQGYTIHAAPPAARARPLGGTAIHLVHSNGVADTIAPAPDGWTLRTGDALVATIPAGTSALGLELIPASKREPLVGLRIDAQPPGESAWRELKLVDQPFDPTYELDGQRLRKTALRALRVRFAPVEGGRLRILRTAPEPLNVKAVCLFEG